MSEQLVGALHFNLDLSQPLYEQILVQMRSFITKGGIPLGGKIPSVRDMARELKINPNTVMHAYQELERDGLTEKRRGQGTFVTTSAQRVAEFRKRIAKTITTRYLEEMRSLGLNEQEIHLYLINESEATAHDRSNRYGK
ncbi:MAG: GntR family transcriptional regulator [Sporolactobacillus sp.]